MRHPVLKTLVVLTVIMAFAAPAVAIGPGIGVRLGGDVSNLSVDPSTSITDGPNTRTGFYGGLYKGFPLAPMTSIEVGAYYAQKGANASLAVLGETETKLDYLEIPALFKFRPLGFGFYGAAGGYLGFKLSSQAKTGSGDYEDVDGFKSTDFGMVFALGMDFPLTALTLNLDIRYDLGLTNVSDVDGQDTKTQAFIASMGFYF